jgi:hypothetical protein
VLEEQGLAYRPDMVLLAFVFNDVPEVERSENYGMQKPWYERDPAGGWVLRGRPVATPRTPRGAWLAGAQTYSALLRLVLGSRPPPPAGIREANLRVPPRRAENVRAFAARLVDPTSATRMLLERMQAACQAAGAELVAVALPHKHDAYLYEPLLPAPPEADEPGFLSDLSRRLAEAGDAVGFRVLSVDRALLAASRAGTLLHVGDGHYDAAGHDVVARTLEPALRALLMERRKRL